MKTTREQIWKDMMGTLSDKHAELVGTGLMPTEGIPKKPAEPPKTIIKTAEEMEDEILFQAFTGGEVRADEDTLAKIATELQRAEINPHVDVTGLNPTPQVIEKKAQRYALPLDERYPLDGYNQVKEAAVYFDQYAAEMPTNVRREYCTNLVKRADELGIAVSPLASTYGSQTYASDGHIKLAFDMRRSVITDEVLHDVLDKVASTRAWLPATSFALLVEEFDKIANLEQYYGTEVPDPYLSVFKGAAQESSVDPKDSVVIGNEYMTMRKLVEFSKLRNMQVAARFGTDFAEEFRKDPRGIFDSMPRDQKLIIMRMVNNNDSSQEGASTS